MSTTHLTRRLKASPARVYRALTTADDVAQWMVPTGMRIEVHAFDAREGGAFCISLTYDAPGERGKTSAHTDTHHGRFVKLVEDREVVQVTAFETDDPALQGEMRITYKLTPADGGTMLDAQHENLPAGVTAADNEMGWNSSLDKLAALVERG